MKVCACFTCSQTRGVTNSEWPGGRAKCLHCAAKSRRSTLRRAKALRGRQPLSAWRLPAAPASQAPRESLRCEARERRADGEESERWKGERWTRERGGDGEEEPLSPPRVFSLDWRNHKQLCESRRRVGTGGKEEKK